ncbi:substrate-binding domain-containing protein [Altericroceibacterium endophyticum]|nr:substrate-binding domain-containing protein [Altericroceibacterium endophyticum]
MKIKALLSLSVMTGALALSACGSNGGEATRNSIRAVGSSTVYPFAKAVAENFARSHPDFTSPIIESTGTGGGMQLFCGGVGVDTPDMVNASRRMKPGELEKCIANGVDNVTEIQIGLDGIAFAAAKDGIDMNLTPELVYRALAAKPYGEEQTAKNWSDVDSSLPDLPILVYGPPSTSGTRDALKELILEKGCEANPDMEAVKSRDEDEYDQICTEVRSDGSYVDQGEQDNLIVQKIEGNPNAVGVFGYSYLEENADKVRGLRMNGVEPTYANISSFEYPGARPLFIYVKDAHLDAIPGLREFVAEWANSWSKGGPLAKIGLVANPDDVAAKNAAAASEFPSLTVEELK